MAARGSTVMQFVPSEVYQSATPPESPAVGQLWRNSSVTPNELVAWTGKGTSNARRYAASKTGTAVRIEDLLDDRKLDVTVKTVAAQAGSGTPSPDNVRAISPAVAAGGTIAVRRCGKNLIDLSRCTFTRCVDNGDGSVRSNITSSIYAAISAKYPEILKTLMQYKSTGLPFTFSCAGNPADTRILVYIYGPRSGGGTFQSVSSAIGAQSISLSIASDFTDITEVLFIVNNKEPAFTDTTSIIRDLQFERAATATTFEMFSGAAASIPSNMALYGMTGYEDEIDNNGHETHRTALLTFNGSEAWVSNGTYTNTARFDLSTALPGGRPVDANKILCTHFNPVYNDLNDFEHCRNSAASLPEYLIIYINKSRMSGWSDALSAAEKANKFKTWLGTNNVQVLYQLAAPTTATVAPVAINGADGVNTVTSDGASVSVAYTGSGWEAVGAVQRVAVEAVKITPEEGLRVDTVLTSADGSQQVPTYFNARGTKYGLFRTSDGMLILGGMVLPNGEPAGVAGALISPGSNGDTRIEIETVTEGSGQARVDTAALHLVQPSFAGATDANPAPTGERTPIRFEAVRSTLLNAQSQYVDHYSASIKALNSMQLIALNESGSELAWLSVQRSSEGSTIFTDGAYSASDRARTLSNFAPMILMTMPASESIVYNATARRFMLDWKTIEDDYGRYETFKGGNQSLRDVGIVIRLSGYYRFAFHVDLEQASSSSGAVLYINRMPTDWTPPTTRDYCLDADLTPTRIAYRRAASAPLNASVTICGLVADLWCFGGEKILPVVSTSAASKTLVSAGTFFTAQKIG